MNYGDDYAYRSNGRTVRIVTTVWPNRPPRYLATCDGLVIGQVWRTDGMRTDERLSEWHAATPIGKDVGVFDEFTLALDALLLVN